MRDLRDMMLSSFNLPVMDPGQEEPPDTIHPLFNNNALETLNHQTSSWSYDYENAPLEECNDYYEAEVEEEG